MRQLKIPNPWSLLQSAARSWALLSFNYRHLSSLLLLLLSGICVFLLWSIGPTYLLAAIFALFGALVGSALTAKAFSVFIDRAREFVEEERLEDHDPEQSLRHTGLSPLDAVLSTHLRQLVTLVDLLETLETEKHKYVERYRTLTENLAASVVIRDEAGKITFCSPYTEVLTGYPLSEIYDSSEDFFLSIVHDDELESYRRALAVSRAGEAFQCRYRFFHKTGIEMWAETRTVPVLDEQGNVLSSLSITLDVTGTVRYQKKVEEKNRELRDFTYMVSHDLKAPIFTIKGMVGVLREDFAADLKSESKEILSHIEEASTRLEALVESVLEYSRITEQGTKAEEIELNTLFEDLLVDFSKQISDARAEISIGELGKARADRLKTYQVFSNLIGNAIKYRDHRRPLKITIAKTNASGQTITEIAVADNGIGIPEDQLDEIFRPFKRVPGTEVEGFGIGLACVKKLVEILNGSIRVESSEGVGSTFTVRLPVG